MDTVVSKENYNELYDKAMQGILDMLFTQENPMASFKRNTYTSMFESFRLKFAPAMEAMDLVYQMEESSAEWPKKLADHLVDEAERRLEAIPKKGKREDQKLNYNMALVIGVFPALEDYKSDCTGLVADAIVEAWNQRFKTTIAKSNYDKIQAGFKTRLCYITTAVCESQGKADDCYELTLLRDYRDRYLMSTKEGSALVEEYYNIAPTIVNRIRKEAAADAVYENIWESYLKPCIHYIENEEFENCRNHYQNMVLDLKGRYMQ